ncbi:MAG TPA: ATP-binding cassette domain-containing protein, partial [Fluviicoccus sp.]|nr:ATP-binding cassette domain-containing protein [Fluviicoccus sp.]
MADLLVLEGIEKRFGGIHALKNVSLRIPENCIYGLIGPNGAGKTTLLKLLTGVMKPDAGTVRLGANIQMASLDQGRDSLDPKATLMETLTGGRGETLTI